MVNLRDLVPWSLIWGAQNERHAQATRKLRQQLREKRIQLMAATMTLTDSEGTPNEHWQGQYVIDDIGDYSEKDIMAALWRAALYRFEGHINDMSMAMIQHHRTVLNNHLAARHTPERVAEYVVRILLRADAGDTCATVCKKQVAPIVFTAYMFLRYLRDRYCPPESNETGLRFEDDYFTK